MTVELFLGKPLIPGYSEYDQLKKIIKIIGKIPDSMLQKANKKIFNYFVYDKGKNSFTLREPKKGEIFDEKSDIYNTDYIHYSLGLRVYLKIIPQSPVL